LSQLADRTLAQAVATSQDGQEGLQPGAESPARHSSRQRGTGAGAAGRAGEPVQAILRHLGLDRRYFSDLVPAGLRVFAVEGLTTLATGGRLHRDSLRDPLRGHQGPLLACMTGLSAPLATGGWLRRSAFDMGRIAGGRPGRVGRVLIEPLSQVIDLLLEGLQPLLILLNEGHDRRLGGRRHLAPEFSRDRWNWRHTCILRPPEARTSSAGEGLPSPFPKSHQSPVGRGAGLGISGHKAPRFNLSSVDTRRGSHRNRAYFRPWLGDPCQPRPGRSSGSPRLRHIRPGVSFPSPGQLCR